MVQYERMHSPQAIARDSWTEIAQIPVIAASFGLEDLPEAERAGVLAEMAYAVRFDFANETAPGYVGELYILHGPALGPTPMVVVRGPAGQLMLAEN